ncbi:MAG: glycosyltransferase [Chloroflexota bacterium]
MKVCLVNLFDLDPPRNGGLSRVAFIVSELMAEMAEQGNVKVFFAVGWRFSDEFRPWLGRSGGEVVPVLPEVGLTPLLEALKPDLVISPLFGMKPCADWDTYRGIPHIASVPDALALDKPELFNAEERENRFKTYQQLRSATKVVTLTADARQRLIRHLGLSEDQIVTVPLAGDMPGDVSAANSGVAKDFAESQVALEYILYPARNWPHKRHELLLNIMREISRDNEDLKLVLTGWHDKDAIKELAVRCKLSREKIIELNYVPDARMKSLYRNAKALMFVSAYEGFGMPILEAMQNGCPVICAPLTSIPEVAGDAALYVDSDDPSHWAAVFLDELPRRRKSLIQKGYKQANKFSWDRTKALWRDLIAAHLDQTTSRDSLSLPYLQELRTWAHHYRVSQEQMAEKEEVIQLFKRETTPRFLNEMMGQVQTLFDSSALLKVREENERLQIENEHLRMQVLEKERVVQSFRTSFLFGLQHGPFRSISIFRLLQPVAIKLRDFRRIFLPKVGVLEQHAPQPLELPEHYRTFPIVEPARAPRISIVTPSFRQAAFIERTVKSVLDQGYPNLEYAIQDGGSTDGTVEVLQPYLSRLTHFESRKDRGQAEAINLGMRHVSGEILAYLNSDDVLLPGSLNYVADFFLNNPDVDVIYSHRIIINENDKEIGRWILPRHDNNVILWADYVPQETLFWRRSIWEKAGGQMNESYQFALDWDMLVRFRNAGAKMVRVPRFLAAFRVQSAQKTSMHMNSTGLAEMNRLRRQIHYRDVDWGEIMRNIKPYLNRSVWYHKLHWMGILRY